MTKPIGVLGYYSYGDAVSYAYTTKYIPFHTRFDPTEFAAVLFTGGADISPYLYDQRPHPTVYFDKLRDKAEWYAMAACLKAKIPTIGICRGMQLQCIVNGGTLVQHVTNHVGGKHEVSVGNDVFLVNSLHHQMCRPWESKNKFQVLADATPAISLVYETETPEDVVQMPTEPEAILWPDTKSFGVQWHPEMMGKKAHASDWFITQVKKLLEAA